MKEGMTIQVVTRKNGKAPEIKGEQLTEKQFLKTAEEWLGPEYQSLSNGRYVSKDGVRQVRYGKHETVNKQHHGHFEVYDKPGGKVIENKVIAIIKD